MISAQASLNSFFFEAETDIFPIPDNYSFFIQSVSLHLSSSIGEGVWCSFCWTESASWIPVSQRPTGKISQNLDLVFLGVIIDKISDGIIY